MQKFSKMKQQDTVYSLTKTLSQAEQTRFTKYLSSFGKDGSQRLYKSFVSSKKYDKSALMEKADFSDSNSYQKAKTELKFLLLDFLRTGQLQSENSRWRKYLDYGEVLKERGEKFIEEAYKFFSMVEKESYERDIHYYTPLALKEMSWIAPGLSAKDISSNEDIGNKLIEITYGNYLNARIYNYYIQVSTIAARTEYVRSEADEQTLKKLQSSDLTTFDEQKVTREIDRILLIAAQMLVFNLLGDISKGFERAKAHRHLFEHTENETLKKNLQIQCTYFHGYIGHALVSGHIKEAKNALSEYLNLLEENCKHVQRHVFNWAYFFCFEGLLAAHDKSKDLEEVLGSVKQFYETYHQLLDNQLEQSILQNLMIGSFMLGEIREADKYNTILLKTPKFASIRKDIVEFARLFQLVLTATELKADYDSANRKKLALQANTHYEYFRKLNRKYYQLEILFCKQLHSVEDILKPDQFIDRLHSMEKQVLKLKQEDKFGYFQKLFFHFDFTKWLRTA